MKKGKIIAFSSAALCSMGIGVLGTYAASFTANGRRQTLEQAYAWQQDHYDVSWYASLEKESYTINSFDGYELHVHLCRCGEASDRYVILSHGYTDNHFGTLKYMKLYLDRGYNCISYDLRGHGENAPTFCTYSIREGKDLYELIRDTRLRYPDLRVLGLHGESLGAASTIAALGYRIWAKADKITMDYVDFAVADCPFADIENVLKGAMENSMHLPGGLVNVVSACSKLRYGYSYSQMKPIDMLSDNKVPLLFIHGEDDTFILPENSRRMAAETAGYSEVHLFPGARHANSVLTDPEGYRTIVYSFLDTIGCP